ncbi:NAD(P)/FAD-dependent oxidoreductase [Kribbella sp. VKM Ac-2568]|uniref:NAD(P)/FAD-dependent oxidoreductase n=1 Tax=Kribbella sp. VKM Ac-2568 TaxID=2512219 RepID=UPI00104C151D|nr:NAD(P)/FAD-dependent oxidoreductase [Kribbella sp. VKM Ac-2568]
MSVPRVVIVGAGFAGFHAARGLQKYAPGAEIVLINPTDYFLYVPLLPEVGAGILEPRRICVSLPDRLPKVKLVLGTVSHIDIDGHRVEWVSPEGRRSAMEFDRLVLAAGSVNKLLPIPGVAEYAHGFRGISEALYLRDHITRQLELAASTDDRDEREARCTFVVVGAGYTGTEVAAQGQLFTARLVRQLPALRNQRVRWLLADLAERLLPGLSPRMSTTAERVLRRRGVEVCVGQSVDYAGPECLRMTTGEEIATRSLIWCVGVRPDPLVDALSLPTDHGRVEVHETLVVRGRAHVFACGDCAAVPDLTHPGSITGMTAQHAQRQGKLVARNVAASLTGHDLEPYQHHDLGFLVDLGGRKAAANPLHIPLSGLAAKTVTRGYHLLSLPGNRTRTAADWAINAMMPPRAVQLGLVSADRVRLECTSPLGSRTVVERPQVA